MASWVLEQYGFLEEFERFAAEFNEWERQLVQRLAIPVNPQPVQGGALKLRINLHSDFAKSLQHRPVVNNKETLPDNLIRSFFYPGFFVHDGKSH